MGATATSRFGRICSLVMDTSSLAEASGQEEELEEEGEEEELEEEEEELEELEEGR